MNGPATEPTPEATNIGLIIAGVWLALGFLGCVGTGVAGAMSETLGMNVSYLGVPLFFSGVVAMGVAPFLRTKGQGVAIGTPVGCGCGTFLFAGVMVGVFYVAIWPSL
jgi:hypothetical protein